MAPTELAAILGEGLILQAGRMTVSLSNELVHLPSEQMYQSPIKAVEELVVNSSDAGANHCVLAIPLPPDDRNSMMVFDDGTVVTPQEGRRPSDA